MKKILFSSVLVVAFLFAVSASASEGITGKWQAKMGPNGDMVMTFNFKVTGDLLTGTVTSPMGDQEITNGKVDGNSFSFEIKMRDNAIKHTGTLDGEVIKLKMEMPEGGPQGPPPGGGGGNRPEGGGGPGGPGGPGEMTLTRVK
ncbi:hypothetical protein SLH46_07375 [Draconibacterium sp. IB214405]|uniref:hypothetical protein n=1 Tax=Draconibacterium sp. IB214405 TaxID=3097352 RepID=UPI002A0ADBD1|nr:hypothetical protein [Draconibacterium sp. IB214405]MDX8338998.1 hypothetical protein [Draconibacterium sp. IB214405]